MDTSEPPQLDHDILRSDMWSALTDVSSDALLVLDSSLSIAFAGGALASVLGKDAADLIGITATTLIHPDDHATVRGELGTIAPGSTAGPTQFRVLHADGTPRYVRAVVTNQLQEPNLASIVLSLNDITASIEAKDSIRRRDRDYRRLVEVTTTPIIISRNELVVFANFSALNLLGANTPEQVVDTPVTTYVKGFMPWDKPEELHVATEQYLCRCDGRTASAEFSTAPVLWEGEQATQIMIREVGSQRLAEMNLVYKATHDALTGLPNRSLMLDRLELAGARSIRTQRHYGVLFVDLDRFKAVNDGYGHDVGDELLIQVSQRLLQSIRPGDTVARLGGDEFVVLVEDLESPAVVELVVDRIHRALATPFHINNFDIFINSSIGVLVTAENPGAYSLLQHADAAMYAAKRAGRSRAVWFDESMLAIGSRHQEVMSQIKAAIENDEVIFAVDPIFSIASNQIEAVAAVFLWQHPVQGLVEIEEVVGNEAEDNLSVLLGTKGLRLVLEYLEAHPAYREPSHRPSDTTDQISAPVPGWLSGGVSALELLHPNFNDTLLNGLRASHLDPSIVALQVTEEVLNADPASTKSTLVEAQQAGVRVIIDDFCASAMSLRLLQELRPNYIKLDERCIRDVVSSAEIRDFVQSVIAIAHALGIGTIAKGVETSIQRDLLGELGCDLAQGRYYGPLRIPLGDGEWTPAILG